MFVEARSVYEYPQRCRRQVINEGAVWAGADRLFHVRDSATGNARSPRSLSGWDMEMSCSTNGDDGDIRHRPINGWSSRCTICLLRPCWRRASAPPKILYWLSSISAATPYLPRAMTRVCRMTAESCIHRGCHGRTDMHLTDWRNY